MTRADATARAVPRWLPPLTLALALAGTATSSYLTVEHYAASGALACPETGVINCQKVTTSTQSEVLGIPVALLGLLFFAVMALACAHRAWLVRHPLMWMGRVLLALAGTGFVAYLMYAELFVIDAICLWCTAVHAITIALFATVAYGTALIEPNK